MAQARTKNDQRTIDDLRDVDVEDAADYAEQLRIEEERYVLDPTYRAPRIDNRGFMARSNISYFDFDGDHEGDLTEEEKKELEEERMRQFRENYTSMCEMIDEALGLDDDSDPLMEWMNDTDWDSGFEYQTWDEMVDQNPDLFVDNGFTCGITAMLRDELYGSEFDSWLAPLPEPEPEPAYLTYDVNPVTGEKTELSEDQKISRKIAYDADQIVQQSTSLTMVDDIIKDVSRKAATQTASAPLIQTDLNLTESFATATTAPAPTDDPAPNEPEVAATQPVVKQPEAAPAL